MKIPVKQEMSVNTEDGVMRVCIVDITPECAKRILEYNTSNRKIKPARVTQYTSDMINSRWKSNGTPIIISNNWVLKDGQHRLLSVIKSGITLYNSIVVFVPEDNANAYDLNAVRSVKDILMLDGEKDKIMISNSCAGAINYCIKTTLKNWEHNNNAGELGVTKSLTISEMKKHHNALEFIYPYFSARKIRISKAPVMAAAINAYLSGCSEESLKNFLQVLSSGITQNPLDIQVIKLRDYISSVELRSPKHNAEIYYKTQSCLHNYECGIIRQKLGNPSTEYYKYPLIDDNNKQLQLEEKETKDEELSNDELMELFRAKMRVGK